jgi:hypothetical protein
MIIDEIRKLVSEKGAELSEKKGFYTFQFIIAERKVFFSRKKLEYIARFRIVEETKELNFTEMLKEKSSGISIGGGDDMSPGFGFKKTSYSTGADGISGTIQEQSSLFGKNYSYKFDYSEIRKAFESIALKDGYSFKYQITPIGL